MNLKQVRFKLQTEGTDHEKASISVTGKKQLTAGDFQKFITGFQVLNPDLVICNMEPEVAIKMDITIEKGSGYVSAEENTKANQPVGTIPTDANLYTY